MGSFDPTLVGLPLAFGTLLPLINLGNANSFYSLIITLIAAVTIGGAIYAVLSSIQSISFLTFSISISDWGKRFGGIVAFMGTYFIGVTLTGLNLLISVPMGLGVIIWGIITMMFIVGVFRWSVGDTAGGTG